MKNTILSIAAIAACMMISCTKTTVEAPEKGPVTLEITGNEDIRTKSTSAASESAVNKLEVLVFNSAGMLDGYAKVNSPAASSGKYTVTLNCSRGTGMTVCAFANSASDISVTTYSAYQALVSSLSGNSTSGLQMAGVSTGVNLSSGSASLSLSRFVAKVQIDKITNAFLHDLTVDAIYLINVNPTCPYTMVSTAATAANWINKSAYSSSAVDALVHDSVSKTVSAGSNLTETHYFYTYPNPTTTDSSVSTFSARYTRLVVEGTLEGKKTYYPINIVGTGNTLDANTLYKVTNLNISGPGSDSPDVLPSRGSVSVSITITDWKTGFSKEVTY